MIELLECTCIEAYKARNMRDPNCCACSCDHNDLVEQLAKANERADKAESRLKESNKALAGMFWYFTPDGDKYPLAEKALNKFAIEKKIEALDLLKRKAVESIHRNWIVNPMNAVESPGIDVLMTQSVGLNTTMIDSFIEQLRKEQE